MYQTAAREAGLVRSQVPDDEPQYQALHTHELLPRMLLVDMAVHNSAAHPDSDAAQN